MSETPGFTALPERPLNIPRSSDTRDSVLGPNVNSGMADELDNVVPLRFGEAIVVRNDVD